MPKENTIHELPLDNLDEPLLRALNEDSIEVTRAGANLARMLGLDSPTTLARIADLLVQLRPDADLLEQLECLPRAFARGVLR